MVRKLANPQAIDWLLDRNEAIAARSAIVARRRPFLASIATAAHEARELLLLLAFERAEPVAGIMILRHGVSATYEVGYVSAGRPRAARHPPPALARDGALLRKRARWLDLGGIATDRSPGIARFKLGMGGEP